MMNSMVFMPNTFLPTRFLVSSGVPCAEGSGVEVLAVCRLLCAAHADISLRHRWFEVKPEPRHLAQPMVS